MSGDRWRDEDGLVWSARITPAGVESRAAYTAPQLRQLTVDDVRAKIDELRQLILEQTVRVDEQRAAIADLADRLAEANVPAACPGCGATGIDGGHREGCTR